MPHANSLDLSIFPSMSHSHSSLTRKKGKAVVSPDEIAKAAQQVYDEYPSCNIARAFMQVRLIADRVVEYGGDNSFLGKDLHFGIRDRYFDTIYGIKLKDEEE